MVIDKIGRKWLMRLRVKEAASLFNQLENHPGKDNEYRQLCKEQEELCQPSENKPQAARDGEIGMDVCKH
jgi:hypothetical protein